MEPLTLGLLSALPSLLQTGLGWLQNSTGDAYGDTVRPTKTVPTEVLQALNLSRSRAASPLLPGQGLMTNELRGNEATAANRIIQGGGSSGDIGANIGNLDLGTQSSLRKIQEEGIKHQDEAQSGYESMLNKVGEYRDKAWDWNVGNPYLAKQAAANNLQQTGQANIFNGIKGGIQSAILASLFPKSNSNNTAPYGNTGGNGAFSGYDNALFKSVFGGGVPLMDLPDYNSNNGSV